MSNELLGRIIKQLFYKGFDDRPFTKKMDSETLNRAAI